MSDEKAKIVARATKAGKTNKVEGSLVKCEVRLESGEWISPDSCKTFYIDEDAKFPEIVYEIKTNKQGPYNWSWKIEWIAKLCYQKPNKKRYEGKSASDKFRLEGSFSSTDKKWTAELVEVAKPVKAKKDKNKHAKDNIGKEIIQLTHRTLGGLLTVTVKAGRDTFVRKTIILGKNPTKTEIIKDLDKYSNKNNVELANKIIKQESEFIHFYTDDMPHTSFDKGYGLGQLTNPKPTYEQIWNWKAHIKEIMEKRIPMARSTAKKHLDAHPGYSQDVYDLETLAAYNGIPHEQFYHNWDSKTKKWVVNENVICDPKTSNTGWDMEEDENQGKTLEKLRKDKTAKPFYTGRCYAEHIRSTQQ